MKVKQGFYRITQKSIKICLYQVYYLDLQETMISWYDTISFTKSIFKKPNNFPILPQYDQEQYLNNGPQLGFAWSTPGHYSFWPNASTSWNSISLCCHKAKGLTAHNMGSDQLYNVMAKLFLKKGTQSGKWI